MRILKNQNEFIDIMSQMSGRKFVTFGYVCSAKLKNLPQGQRLNPATGRMNKYDDMEAFGKQLGYDNVGGILKLSRYNLRFMNANDFSTAYKNFKANFDELKKKHDYPESTRKVSDKSGKYTSTMQYGHGVSVYDGDNDDLQGRTYTKQDINGAKIKSKYYLIDKNGNIIREYTKDELKDYFDNEPRLEQGVAAMRKIGREESKIQAYIDDLLKIKMSPMSFEFSQILYMVGTCNKEKFLCINYDNLRDTISSVDCKINTQQFVKIAEELYKDSFIDLNNMENGIPLAGVNEALNIFHNGMRLFESNKLFDFNSHCVLNESGNQEDQRAAEADVKELVKEYDIEALRQDPDLCASEISEQIFDEYEFLPEGDNIESLAREMIEDRLNGEDIDRLYEDNANLTELEIAFNMLDEDQVDDYLNEGGDKMSDEDALDLIKNEIFTQDQLQEFEVKTTSEYIDAQGHDTRIGDDYLANELAWENVNVNENLNNKLISIHIKI